MKQRGAQEFGYFENNNNKVKSFRFPFPHIFNIRLSINQKLVSPHLKDCIQVVSEIPVIAPL